MIDVKKIFTYDVVSSPGFSSAKLVREEESRKEKIEGLLNEFKKDKSNS